MSKEPIYTAEQMKMLAENPNTYKVTPYRLTFTREFKEFFYEEYRKPGMNTRKALAKAGYDTSIFKASTLARLTQRIKDEALSPEGFKNPRGLSKEESAAAFAKENLAKKKTETAIKELQDRVVYLEAEIEFLKKISSIRNHPDTPPPDGHLKP